MALNERSRQDVRKLLKQFGIKADESITTYLEQHPDCSELKVRLTLEDSGQGATQAMEALVIDGSVRR